MLVLKLFFCGCRDQYKCSSVTYTCIHDGMLPCSYYCNQHVISGSTFKAAYARVHLTALSGNGLCSLLCDAEDDHAEGRQQEFRKLIKDLQQKKEERERKRKWQQNRLDNKAADAEFEIVAKKKPKLKQPKLKDFMKVNDATAADIAVASWAFAHDIPPNALKGPY